MRKISTQRHKRSNVLNTVDIVGEVFSIVISYAESEVEPHSYRTEPVLEEVNCAASLELRNRLTDVALLMNR